MPKQRIRMNAWEFLDRNIEFVVVALFVVFVFSTIIVGMTQ